MVGYNSLLFRRELLLGLHFFKLLSGVVDNPSVLELVSFFIPDCYVRARVHSLFRLPPSRTNIRRRSPIVRALSLFNSVLVTAPELDLFFCSLAEFRSTIVTCLDDSRSAAVA